MSDLYFSCINLKSLGQSVLSSYTGDMSDCRYYLTKDPGIEIDHELISTAILRPSTDSRSLRVVVSYKRKYVHGVLVNCQVKIAQEKSVIR